MIYGIFVAQSSYNVKGVSRIRREEGIKVSKKQRRVKRVGISTAERPRHGAGTSWPSRQKMEAVFSRPGRTHRNALAFIKRGRSWATDVITVVEAAGPIKRPVCFSLECRIQAWAWQLEIAKTGINDTGYILSLSRGIPASYAGRRFVIPYEPRVVHYRQWPLLNAFDKPGLIWYPSVIKAMDSA